MQRQLFAHVPRMTRIALNSSTLLGVRGSWLLRFTSEVGTFRTREAGLAMSVQRGKADHTVAYPDF
jgi:hypothetical protein